jgi:hypothetical protein
MKTIERRKARELAEKRAKMRKDIREGKISKSQAKNKMKKRA